MVSEFSVQGHLDPLLWVWDKAALGGNRGQSACLTEAERDEGTVQRKKLFKDMHPMICFL